MTFLKRHGLLERPARFDVIAITWPADKWFPTIEHIQERLRGGRLIVTAIVGYALA